MTPENWTRVAAALMAMDVGLGAFAAHGLKSRLSPDMMAVFETAVRYQAYHALGLLAVACLKGSASAAWCFIGGIFLFSGSLYALALTGIRGFGAVTPLGGVLFIAGWLLIAFRARG